MPKAPATKPSTAKGAAKPKAQGATGGVANKKKKDVTSSANTSTSSGGSVDSALSFPLVNKARGGGGVAKAASVGTDPVARSGTATTVFPIHGELEQVAVRGGPPFIFCSTSITTVGDIRTVTIQLGKQVSTYQCEKFFLGGKGRGLQNKYWILAAAAKYEVDDVALEAFAFIHLLHDINDNVEVRGRTIWYATSSLASLYAFTDSCTDIISGDRIARPHVRRCLTKINALIEEFNLPIEFYFEA